MFKRMSWMILVLLFSVVVSVAQESCEAIVQQAIETASANCEGLRRNEACYGNVTIDAEAAPDVDDFTFSSAGDFVNVSDIASMRLSSQIEETGDWGISIMQVPVITDEGTENAQFVLFGDVEITNVGAVEEIVEPVTIELTSTGTLNVRGGASTNNAVVGSLANGDVITAIARNEAGDWVQFVQEDGSFGWVFVSLMSTEADVMTLEVSDGELILVEDAESSFSTMQAFNINIDLSTSTGCEDQLTDGILIQTPEGTRRILLRINEVTIELGSTAFIDIKQNSLYVYLLEGNAFVSAVGATTIVPASTFVTVPLDVRGVASGNPSEFQSYDISILRLLPLLLLNDQTTPAISLGSAPIILDIYPVPTGVCDFFLAVDFLDQEGDVRQVDFVHTRSGSDYVRDDTFSIGLLPPIRAERENTSITVEEQQQGATTWAGFQGNFAQLTTTLFLIDAAGNRSETVTTTVFNPTLC